MPRQANGQGSKPRYDAARGKWVVNITVDGKQRPIRAETERAVVLAAQKALVGLAEGLPLPSNQHTVRTYLEEWHTGQVQDARLRATTLRGYLVNIRHISASSVGRVRLGQFSPQDVQKLRRELAATGLGAKTVSYVIATLRVALGDAVEFGLLPRNVAQVARRRGRKRNVEEPDEHVRPLTSAQIDDLYGALTGERLRALFVLAVVLGLRRGELLGLRWADVDFARRQIHVRWQLAEVTGDDGVRRLDFEPLKTRGSRRTIDLPDPLQDVLLAHCDRQLFERRDALNLWQKRDLVFCTEFGAGIETTTLYRIWDRVRKAAGFNQRFHDLRHTAASQMLAEGAELWQVSKVLGHSSYQLTVDTYGHLYQETRRELADRMGARLSVSLSNHVQNHVQTSASRDSVS